MGFNGAFFAEPSLPLRLEELEELLLLLLLLLDATVDGNFKGWRNRFAKSSSCYFEAMLTVTTTIIMMTSYLSHLVTIIMTTIIMTMTITMTTKMAMMSDERW